MTAIGSNFSPQHRGNAVSAQSDKLDMTDPPAPLREPPDLHIIDGWMLSPMFCTYCACRARCFWMPGSPHRGVLPPNRTTIASANTPSFFTGCLPDVAQPA